MKTRPVFVSLFILMASISANAQKPLVFEGEFKEDFSEKSSQYFDFNYRRNGEDFRYTSGYDSKSEPGTKVMLYRFDPQDPAGAGRGPEIISKNYTWYGSYSARIKLPDVRKIQPNTGAVIGYFTYNVDPKLGLSEIDIEFLVADPRIIYVGTWTGKGVLNRVGRTINLATGEIYETIWRGEVRNEDGTVTKIPNTPFTGKRQNKPASIKPIEGFDASAAFYTYGWDWYPDRMVWWILHPETGKKIILWDYKGPEIFPGQPSNNGVPSHQSKYRLNFWHTNNWPVETNPKSIEKPLHEYEVEIDWMSYKPFNSLIKKANK